MHSSIPVIIPSWNGRHLLGSCLNAVERQQGVVASIIVVDNGSTDDTSSWLAHAYPHVTVIKNEQNRGFAAAINQGILGTQSEWLALLNNDAIPDPEWLAHLVSAGLRDPMIGAVASRLMFQGAPEYMNSAGIRVDSAGVAWDLWAGDRDWPEAPMEVFGASGGACLLRRSMLDDIGLFEEDFFAYGEDVDLAWRGRLRGWRAVLAPSAVAHHALSATAIEGSPFKKFQLANNRWRVIIRNYPTWPLLLHLPIILFYDLLPVVHALVRRDTIALRGRIMALLQLPTLLKQRRAIQRRRVASWRSLREAMSPVESPLSLYHRSLRVARLASGNVKS